MAGFIAKQPNGLYCRFSSVVDTITHDNMTFDDYVKVIMERGYNEEYARKEADEIINGKYLRPFERVLESFVPANDSIEDFKNWCRSVGYQGDFKPYENWWQDFLNEIENEEL